ncbi:AFG1/ZapE family ATPase [Cohnella silvisoli]|uniref:DnaA/Hda family protein n=1 Tax=Cohnella silvisoli TaxID=2873699 RepID=A0ABV1L2E4_9BACL|nr:AFG1/ZapE family ATPase [Cohnella silvisoli]MCD9025771.1 cell division protein ZapE [Cohnella silvisoli]
MLNIKEVLDKSPDLHNRVMDVMTRYTPDYFRDQLPELVHLGVTDQQINRAGVLLLDCLQQRSQCLGCTDYHNCRRPPGQEGMIVAFDLQRDQLCGSVKHCEQLESYHQEVRWQRLLELSGKAVSDKDFTFENFPVAQKRRHKKLCTYVHTFAKEYKAGDRSDGVYIFGPPGTAKTHLMQAMVNGLEDRRVPVLFIRTDAIFRNMRAMLSKKESLDSLIEAYCTTPILVIDEFGQEAGTDFTIDVMFEIVNARFTGKLPTFCTSNYAPDMVYAKAAKKYDLGDKVDAIRSRLHQMMHHTFMDGEDGRRLNRPSFF